MKKIIVFAFGVLLSTLGFAKGPVVPARESSAVGVLSSFENNKVKVYYKAPRSSKVKISILNEQGDAIFTETMRKTDGFMRPYNFDALPEGSYTIEIEDAFGKQVEKLNYHSGKTAKIVHLSKLVGEENKYVLTGRTAKADNILVRIYDSSNVVVFEESRNVTGEFGEIYNLKNVSGSFTIEVADSHGVLTSLHY